MVAMGLPGWNSAEASGWWSGLYFWAGLVCLLLLGVTEILSHRYAERRSDLLAQAESAAEAQKGAVEAQKDEVEAQRAGEVDALRRQLADAQSRAASAVSAAIEARKPHGDAALRRLTDHEKETLLFALSPFAGQRVTFKSVLGDAEGKRFIEDFIVTLRRARWSFDDKADVSQAVFDGQPVGVQVTVNAHDAEAGKVPPAAAEFVRALDKLGVTVGHTLFASPQIPAGSIELVVGTKTPRR
jgi:hypothetical protein